MKRILSVLLSVLLIISVIPTELFPVNASAATTSGTTGECTWTLDGTVLTISGNGKMGNYTEDSRLPWGRSITKVIIEYGVTHIGDYAFYDCIDLRNITIPNSMTSIGSSAFCRCIRLATITIPDSVTSIGRSVFSYCTKLTSITIPDNVTSIGEYTFFECVNLNTVTIGNSVTSIGNRAFYDCAYLSSINIPNSMTSIGNEAFSNCINIFSLNIPDSVTSIGYSAFSNTSLKSIAIPDSVTRIPYTVFSNCSNLKSITIPNSVTSIVDSAFYGCTSLKDVYYIGSESDKESLSINSYHNDYLTNATWHYNSCIGKEEHTYTSNCDTDCNECGGIREVGDHIYDDTCDTDCNECQAVRTIEHTYDSDYDPECNVCGNMRIVSGSIGIHCTWEVNGTRLTIKGSGAMAYGNEYKMPWYGLNITEIVIEEGITEICAYAFSGLNATKIELPRTVYSIGDHAFYNSKIKEIVLPSVHTVGSYAFYGCDSLEHIWYSGDATNKYNMDISHGNDEFKNAEWHYNICSEEHTYSGICDDSCNNCEWSRVVDADHIYGNDNICDECGHEYKLGDANGDDEVTSKDLTALRRYLADWDIANFVAEAADTNGDGEVTSKDATYLARHLADWDGYSLG